MRRHVCHCNSFSHATSRERNKAPLRRHCCHCNSFCHATSSESNKAPPMRRHCCNCNSFSHATSRESNKAPPIATQFAIDGIPAHKRVPGSAIKKKYKHGRIHAPCMADRDKQPALSSQSGDAAHTCAGEVLKRYATASLHHMEQLHCKTIEAEKADEAHFSHFLLCEQEWGASERDDCASTTHSVRVFVCS
jgi:hypothetical protein